MERRALGVLAVILIALMAIVATAGLDHLPPALKKSVDSAEKQLSDDRTALDKDRTQLEHAITEEPLLLGKQAAPWRERLDQDRAQLDQAAEKLAALQQLAKANRRSDEEKVQRDLRDFNSLRDAALRDGSGVETEAERRVAAKRALPARIQTMKASYESLENIDSGTAAAPIQKAINDWPAKRDDLQARIGSLGDLKSQGQKVWDSSAPLRMAAEQQRLADADIDTLLDQADRMDSLSRQADQTVTTTAALAGQLYVGWDKLLLDVERGHDAREKVRIVSTRFPDSTLAHGVTTSEDRWEPLDTFTTHADEHTGMVIERKPAGKYDSEAEHDVQPPAYAYIAPPGQSNAYGSWSGGVWHWLPEYLLLSHLLHSSQGPIYVPDYDAYRYARSRGEVFYGRNHEYYTPRPSAPQPSSSNGWYTERPRGGFAGSQYQSHGSFSGSQYRSRGTFGSSGFGSSGARSYARSRGGRR
ncbi:MAG: hypothetical protein JO307_25800 [Bryobacterales bacterium]|nr:hypothetical protein [Bryobacterales bacterium]MBV9398218.1 hypothetical protein [Bryobacterales bacterium]